MSPAGWRQAYYRPETLDSEESRLLASEKKNRKREIKREKRWTSSHMTGSTAARGSAPVARSPLAALTIAMATVSLLLQL